MVSVQWKIANVTTFWLEIKTNPRSCRWKSLMPVFACMLAWSLIPPLTLDKGVTHTLRLKIDFWSALSQPKRRNPKKHEQNKDKLRRGQPYPCWPLYYYIGTVSLYHLQTHLLSKTNLSLSWAWPSSAHACFNHFPEVHVVWCSAQFMLATINWLTKFNDI